MVAISLDHESWVWDVLPHDVTWRLLRLQMGIEFRDSQLLINARNQAKIKVHPPDPPPPRP
jgi:hypothetical protein